MAQTIYIKNSEVAGVTPSSLGKGEIAINIADGNLFYGDSGGNVSQKFSFIHSGATSIGALTATSGTFRSHVNISGDTRTDGKLYVGDGSGLYTDKIRRFTANDNTTKILLNSNVIKIHAGHSTDELVNLAGSEVAIDGALTTNSGITSIGNIHVSADTYFADNSQAIFGNSSDLKIYHSGSHSIIQEAGTGNLLLKGGAVKIMGTTTGEDCAVFTENAGVELYYNDVKRFETNSDGVNVNAFTATSGNFRSNVNVSGTTTLTTVDINGGTIDGTTIATSNITVSAEKLLSLEEEGQLDTRLGLLTTSTAQNLAILQNAASNVDFGNYTIRASTLYSDVTTGTAPFTVASTTVVPNLHAASATSVMTNANLTGDITSVGNATSIASGVIINADVKSDAAIEQTKLDTNVDLGGNITFGNQVDDIVTFTGPVSSNTRYSATQHILRSSPIYINADDWGANNLYFGHSTGNQPFNWNDATAAGGNLADITTLSISEDDMRWGSILPFDISKIEIQCSVRPGGACTGDDFFVGLFTAARLDCGGANMTITMVAHSQDLLCQGKYATNDLSYTANLSKGSMIFIGIGSTDTTTAKNAPGLLNVTITQR